MCTVQQAGDGKFSAEKGDMQNDESVFISSKMFCLGKMNKMTNKIVK